MAENRVDPRPLEREVRAFGTLFRAVTKERTSNRAWKMVFAFRSRRVGGLADFVSRQAIPPLALRGCRRSPVHREVPLREDL